MEKRKREAGFTLIELMIVIAVIGILAVVLVPKVGGIKTQAKAAGIDVNMRTAQAYVAGRIDYWISTGYTTGSTVITEINGAVGDTVNPLDSTKKGVVATSSISNPVNGTVYVVIPDTAANMAGNGIEITSYDSNGNVYKTITVKQ